MISTFKIFIIRNEKKVLMHEAEDEDEQDKEFAIDDLIKCLNSFSFLNATRACSVDDFVEKIDKKTVANNVILICAKELKTEINAKI